MSAKKLVKQFVRAVFRIWHFPALWSLFDTMCSKCSSLKIREFLLIGCKYFLIAPSRIVP